MPTSSDNIGAIRIRLSDFGSERRIRSYYMFNGMKIKKKYVETLYFGCCNAVALSLIIPFMSFMDDP